MKGRNRTNLREQRGAWASPRRSMACCVGHHWRTCPDRYRNWLPPGVAPAALAAISTTRHAPSASAHRHARLLTTLHSRPKSLHDPEVPEHSTTRRVATPHRPPDTWHPHRSPEVAHPDSSTWREYSSERPLDPSPRTTLAWEVQWTCPRAHGFSPVPPNDSEQALILSERVYAIAVSGGARLRTASSSS